MKKYEEALECFNKSLHLYPSYVVAVNNKGIALNNMNRFQEAFKCFEKAIQLNPKFAEAFNNKGKSVYN
jgi:tetratricopeptide (TPR) repeat protein